MVTSGCLCGAVRFRIEAELANPIVWHCPDSATVMVTMGALDDTGDLKLSGHYWVEAKGTYYEIVPRHPTVSRRRNMKQGTMPRPEG